MFVSIAKQLILNLDGESQVADCFEALFIAMINPFGVFEVIFDFKKQVSDYRLIRCNPAFQKMFGIEFQELKENLNHQTFLGGGSHWLDVFSRVALEDRSLKFEYYSSETDCHYEVQAFSPTLGTFACLFSNVIDQKVAQRSLEVSNDYLKTIEESIGELVVSPKINEKKRLKLASQCCEIPKFSLRVLLVDDEDSIRFILANFLSDMGMIVDEAAGIREAFDCLKKQHYDYVLTDFHMDEMNGDEFALKAKEKYPILRFISISADPNFDRTDVYSGFIAKPFDLKSIAQLFNKLSVK